MTKKGYKQTKKHRKKISKMHIGKRPNEETKRKISEAHKCIKMKSGIESSNWRGGLIARNDYNGIHLWIESEKGKAKNYKCVDCNKPACDWSNIDHKYKKNLNDYMSRCRSCHCKWDKINNNTHRGPKNFNKLIKKL